MNGWVFAKGGPTTLGFLNRHDLPYHYALADAYTIGDAYHCSVMSATGPNRTYLWGGSINASKQHGPFTAYSGGDEMGKFLPWEAYGETLQKVGLSWHVYQCADDYGDNGMEYFKTFAVFDPDQGGTPGPGQPLGNPFYEHGVANVSTDRHQEMTNADDLAQAIRSDVLNGTLPQVSWVVNNQFFSEHPVTAPSNGAYFLKALLNALNADPEVFNSTLVIINYDENDGQFDHVPPPVPPQGEFDEFVDSGTLREYGINVPLPVGFGFRVPLILISPWTRGGWVTSEVSDHTSVLQSWRSGRRRSASRALPEHQLVASPSRRRPIERLRLQLAGVRSAETTRPRRADPGGGVHAAAGQQRDAEAGIRQEAGPTAALPAQRQSGRPQPRRERGTRGLPRAQQRWRVRHQGQPLLGLQQPRGCALARCLSRRFSRPVHGRRGGSHGGHGRGRRDSW